MPQLGFRFRSDSNRASIGLESVSGLTGQNWIPTVRGVPKGLKALALLAVSTRLVALRKQPKFKLVELGTLSSAYALYSATSDAFTEAGKTGRRWGDLVFGSVEAFDDVILAEKRGRYTEASFVTIPDQSGPTVDLQFYLDGVPVCECTESLELIRRSLYGRGDRPPLERLRLAVLGSAKLAYIQDSFQGFKAHLKELAVPFDVHAEHFANPVESPTTPEGALIWKEYVKSLLDDFWGEQPDYWIAAGSQAARALRLYYDDNFGVPDKCPPVIFMGVTYPVAMHLVDCLHSRREPRQVCGVAYGADGLRSIVAMIHHVIRPKCEIRFIYFEEYPQDVEAAAQLEKTQLAASGSLKIVKATRSDLVKLLKDEDPVYVSWFTFEAIFEERTPESRPILELIKRRKVVATTKLNCRRGLAFAACCADDDKIGRSAAELLYLHATHQIHLGHRDVVIPEIKYWLNEQQAQECGIGELDDDLRKYAEKFGEDGDDSLRTDENEQVAHEDFGRR